LWRPLRARGSAFLGSGDARHLALGFGHPKLGRSEQSTLPGGCCFAAPLAQWRGRQGRAGPLGLMAPPAAGRSDPLCWALGTHGIWPYGLATPSWADPSRAGLPRGCRFALPLAQWPGRQGGTLRLWGGGVAVLLCPWPNGRKGKGEPLELVAAPAGARASLLGLWGRTACSLMVWAPQAEQIRAKHSPWGL
jgi:hypothetical protein